MRKFTKQDYQVLFVIGTIGATLLIAAVWPHLIAPRLRSSIEPVEVNSRIATTFGYTFLIFATLIALLHIRFAWIRPLLHYFRHRSFENYTQSSSVPLLVEWFLLFGSFLVSPSTSIGIYILVIGLVNPGSMHWAFLSMVQMARASARD